jgi:hypothetical protein
MNSSSASNRRVASNRTKQALGAVTMVVCLRSSAPAMAQEEGRFELAAGYSHAVIQHDVDRVNYQGWAIEENTYVRPHIAIAGLVDAVYWTFTVPTTQEVVDSKRRYGVLGGIRVTGERDHSIVPFAHILAGIAHAHSTLGPSGPRQLDLSDSAFALQPGGGVDVRGSRRWWVRTSVAARVNGAQHSLAWHFPEWRFGAGVAYRFQP